MLYGLLTMLPFTACLFWTTVLALDWRRNNAAQHVLTMFMGASSLLYLCHATFFNHVSTWVAVRECIYAFCNIGVFPLYYLYICRLTDSRGLSLRHLVMLLPAVVIGLWATALHIFFPGDVGAENVRLLVMRIVFMVQMVPICLICYRRLRIFDNEIANYYADTETRSMRPTRRMMVLLVIAALISGASNFLGREYFDNADLLIVAPSLLFTILLFGVGYVGSRQEFCIDDLIGDEHHYNSLSESTEPSVEEADKNPEGDNASTPESTSDEQSHIIAQLDCLMADTQLFLRHDLRLSEVATILGVGRTTLSQRINQEKHLSFSDYINRLRVDYACRLLSEPESAKMTLAGVAERCGFSSDSSFYRGFRRHVGMTPKQYIESLKL